MIAIQVLAVAVGLAAVVVTLLSAARTVLVPRAENPRITRTLFEATRVAFRWAALRTKSADRRERILSRYAPVSLLMLPFVWAGCIVYGMASVFWGLGLDPATDAILFSGSAFTTLGTVGSENFYYLMIAAVEAVLGLVVIALLISFLPSIYSHFSYRESLVTRLEALAGVPFDPDIAIRRAHRIGLLPVMDDVWAEWATWFASLEESHTTFSFLAFFRSPEPNRSWLNAGVAILDTAALRMSVVAGPSDPRAPLMIRTGYLALRRIADQFDISYDESPKSDDPISITKEEFFEMLDSFEEVDLPMIEDRDEAWRKFAGWRVNYDAVAVGLADLILAPPDCWRSTSH